MQLLLLAVLGTAGQDEYSIRGSGSPLRTSPTSFTSAASGEPVTPLDEYCQLSQYALSPSSRNEGLRQTELFSTGTTALFDKSFITTGRLYLLTSVPVFAVYLSPPSETLMYTLSPSSRNEGLDDDYFLRDFTTQKPLTSKRNSDGQSTNTATRTSSSTSRYPFLPRRKPPDRPGAALSTHMVSPTHSAASSVEFLERVAMDAPRSSTWVVRGPIHSTRRKISGVIDEGWTDYSAKRNNLDFDDSVRGDG
ncbi:hypothetical protein E2P81_ATG05185 [Venturia nashicola]|nr:hypothetical protein E2P81_ATG05185 [Venturia nashicola]